jgi:phosphatidylserine decarboxylase
MSVDGSSAASVLARIFLQEDLNFLVTNRIPRRLATELMGRFSRIESPLLARASIAVWRLFADDLRLHEAKVTQFGSLHECFVRELRPGARPIHDDPDVVTSPCDAVVGARGRIDRRTLLQAKGSPYTLDDLLVEPSAAARYEGGLFVTLRLKSNMYHRFHAPADVEVRRILYHSGDTWNVNPIALRRVEKLFCKNERAVVELVTRREEPIALVAVASILVASIALACLEAPLDLRYRGPNELEPRRARFAKGEELGHFQSGSTIIVLAKGDYRFDDDVVEGRTIRVGRPLLRRNP